MNPDPATAADITRRIAAKAVGRAAARETLDQIIHDLRTNPGQPLDRHELTRRLNERATAAQKVDPATKVRVDREGRSIGPPPRGLRPIAVTITVCLWGAVTALAVGVVARAVRWAAGGFRRR